MYKLTHEQASSRLAEHAHKPQPRTHHTAVLHSTHGEFLQATAGI